MKLCNIAIPNNNAKPVVSVLIRLFFIHAYGQYPLIYRFRSNENYFCGLRGFSFIPACCIGLNSKNNPNKSQWQQRVTFKIRLRKVKQFRSLKTSTSIPKGKTIKRPRCNGVILRVDSYMVVNKCLSNMLGCKGRGIANGLQTCEGKELEVQIFKLKINFK